MPSLIAILVALMAVMVVFAKDEPPSGRGGRHRVRMGIAAFATVPPLQAHVVEGRERAASRIDAEHRRVQRRQCARRVAAALRWSTVLALDALPWVAVAVTFAALVVTWFAMRLDARRPARGTAPAAQ